MPAPLSHFQPQNVIGHLRAYLNQYLLGPLCTYFSPTVQETLTKLAREQAFTEDLPKNEVEPLTMPFNASKPLD